MSRAPYVDRAAEAEALAPVAPPCFSDRLTWVEYLKSAASLQREQHAPGPLLIVAGQPVRFNRSFAFCADCTAQHADAMTRAGRCDMNYLLNLIPPDPPAAPAPTPQAAPAAFFSARRVGPQAAQASDTAQRTKETIE